MTRDHRSLEETAPKLERSRGRGYCGWIAVAMLTISIAACDPAPTAQIEDALARLSAVPTNAIADDPDLFAIAMTRGKEVYDAQCVSCHGADLAGVAALHAPDLTDADWLFAGDDFETGGRVHFTSDIEKTIRTGIRADHPETKNDAVMPAMGPQGLMILTDAEIEDVTDYVLLLGGQEHDAGRAANATFVWDDKGSCFECHDYAGLGNQAIGGTDLTQPRLYLYGSDRASIRQSIAMGRQGRMPAYEDILSPEEIKAVSVFVFSNAPPQEIP